MVETIKITYRNSAYYVDRPNWDGGEVVMASDFAELEAEIERTKKWYLDAIEQRDKYARLWDEALSRTGAVKVGDIDRRAKEAADAIGVTPYSDMRLFVEQAVKHALSTLEPAASVGEQDNSFDKEFASIEASIDAGARRSSHRFSLARPAEQAVTEAGAVRREIKSEMEILRRLADGDQIAFSEDGDCAFFTGGDRAFVGPVIISMRSKSYLKRITLNDENYRGTAERDVISDAGMAALKAAMEAGRHD